MAVHSLVSCLLYCSFLVLGCSGENLVINKSLVAEAWQSSVFHVKGECFKQTADRAGHWNYFHSGDSPDSSGYQWLLLKLTRGVRVLSVTVHARPGVRNRASNMEVLLSDRLPASLPPATSSCHANLSPNLLNSFVLCGWTESTWSAMGTQEVTCSHPASAQLTQHILLRKKVSGQNKYLNFQGLGITENATHNITLGQLVADSWQSSGFTEMKYHSECFRNTLDKAGHWDYFHSGGSPDSSGYQWLLLKLTRGVRVLSVTVHARSGELNRASNIEFLLSDRLKVGVLSPTSSCHGNLSHDVISSAFTLCGATEASGNAVLRQVKCSGSEHAHLATYILLRRWVRNETDKYMNFQELSIQTDDAKNFSCSSAAGSWSHCSEYSGDQEQLVLGSEASMKMQLPCKLEAESKPSCFISSANCSHVTDVRSLSITESEIHIGVDSKLSYRWQLQCSYRCTGGQMRNVTRLFGFAGSYSGSSSSHLPVTLAACLATLVITAAVTAAVTAVIVRRRLTASPSNCQSEPAVPAEEIPMTSKQKDPNTVYYYEEGR